jgi:hypothetical protein
MAGLYERACRCTTPQVLRDGALNVQMRRSRAQSPAEGPPAELRYFRAPWSSDVSPVQLQNGVG